MQTVSWTTEEKVGFPNYSNITTRATITREIADDADAPEELKKLVAEVETVMSIERDRVGELLRDAS